MMNEFLVDNKRVYNYNDLLYDIQSTVSYYPIFKTTSLYDYFKNLIIALLSNRPLVLLDSDINPSEINGLCVEDINKICLISELNISSIEDLICNIKSSESEITIFTSGTTGQPKKVVHSILSLSRLVREGLNYKNNVWAFAYNPTHMAGLQVFLQAFVNQNTIVNVFNLSRDFVYFAIEHYSISHISATPTFYRLLLPIEKQFLSVKRVTLGGEKSDIKLYNNIKLIFPNARLNNIYASTEAGSLFVSNSNNFQIPLKIRELIKVFDNELMIHKSLLGKSENFIYDGDFYKTGDLVEWIDEDSGIFCFVSRKNELINIGGYKVNPVEVESIISKINGVRSVVVYGKPNSVLGNVLCAEIVLIGETTGLTELTIKNYLAAQLQDFKIPRVIKFVGELLLTRTGKLKRL